MWNPEQYHKFADARMRPAYDLMAQIPDDAYKSIIDLGCGTGEISQMLQFKYQPDKFVGLDSSESMIDKAKAKDKNIDWEINKIEDFKGNYDLIFSNAALQWVDNHPSLLAKIIKQAKKTIAIQVPNNFNMPSHVLLRETIEEDPELYKKLAHTLRYQPVLTAEQYFDILKQGMHDVNVWETTYLQPLTGDNAVLEWVKGTALTPIKAVLDASTYQTFLTRYQEKLAKAYPKRADGVTVFSFSRLFMVAVRPTVS